MLTRQKKHESEKVSETFFGKKVDESFLELNQKKTTINTLEAEK